MNKNTFTKTLSVVMALSMVALVGGCSKKEETVKKDATQPVFENGTAVVEYYKTDKDGKEVPVTTVIQNPAAQYGMTEKDGNGTQGSGSISSNISVGDKLSEKIKTDEEKKEFADSGSKDFNISKEEAKDIAENAEKWENFSYDFFISNTNSKRLVVQSIQADVNSDVVLKVNLGCEYGIVPGSGTVISISGIKNIAKLQTEEELVEVLKTMNVKLVYALTDETSIDDWDAVDTKTLDIQF